MDMTLTISHLCVSTWVCVCLYVCVCACVCVWSYTQEAHLWLASVFPRLRIRAVPLGIADSSGPACCPYC